jgi:hypothetical protein
MTAVLIVVLLTVLCLCALVFVLPSALLCFCYGCVLWMGGGGGGVEGGVAVVLVSFVLCCCPSSPRYEFF